MCRKGKGILLATIPTYPQITSLRRLRVPLLSLTLNLCRTVWPPLTKCPSTNIQIMSTCAVQSVISTVFANLACLLLSVAWCCSWKISLQRCASAAPVYRQPPMVSRFCPETQGLTRSFDFGTDLLARSLSNKLGNCSSSSVWSSSSLCFPLNPMSLIALYKGLNHQAYVATYCSYVRTVLSLLLCFLPVPF